MVVGAVVVGRQAGGELRGSLGVPPWVWHPAKSRELRRLQEELGQGTYARGLGRGTDPARVCPAQGPATRATEGRGVWGARVVGCRGQVEAGVQVMGWERVGGWGARCFAWLGSILVALLDIPPRVLGWLSWWVLGWWRWWVLGRS